MRWSGAWKGGGGPRHPFPCKNWFFFSISHSKVPKIGITPPPHPNHPRKTQFSHGPAPSQEKAFWIRAWERSSPLEMRWFHPPLLADIQPGIALWNVTTKYYKTMLFACCVFCFFSTLYFKVLVILMVSVVMPHMIFFFWKFKNQYLCDFYTKSLCKANIIHFKLM